MLGTHASKLERWLGAAEVERLSLMMRDWYGPPIAVAGVPGRVMVCGGGDFRGRIETGLEATAKGVFRDMARRFMRALRVAAGGSVVGSGFANADEIYAALTQTKQYKRFKWQKGGFTGVASGTTSLWGGAGDPAAGGNASNAPGGDAPTDATTGGVPFTNPPGGTTLHVLTVDALATLGATALVYDRIFQVNKTMNSTATEAVTGVPTRYQSTTETDFDYAGGNFLFVEVGGTALAATAHNWTTCLYTNQAGTTNRTLPSLTGNSGAIVRRLDHPTGQWYAPLAAGDTGLTALTQMQCSAAVATGVINFVMGHPIQWVPCPIANQVCTVDGVNTAISMERIFDDACLAILDVCKTTATVTNFLINILAAYN
ncbi:MAG: hypothetical protein E6Q97_31690 [Desulfurellales bacterium]|nr:MAG: hypothetical protein E6Q97_31690 [Desulfurellales bacterium]